MEKTHIDNTINRSRFFREIQVWPLLEELNVRGWLNNFKDEEVFIASLILDFFIYYPKNMVDRMLITSVGKAGSLLKSHFSDWNHNHFFSKCYYSFIPGENPNTSDSGYYFTRKLRESLKIPESRFLNYSELDELLEINSKNPLPIILVDDFVGSGAQCDKAWNSNKGNVSKLTLGMQSQKFGHIIVYAPLIINIQGYNRITRNCSDLILSPAHVLGEEYNLFSKNCLCWQGDENLYNKGIELILSKSRLLGIPSTNGRHVNDEKGFGAQGLAIAFEHGAPDAIPAIFYWESENWTPLIKKNYDR